MSSYQQAGVPTDLKRKIAQLGINMLFKMVSRGRCLGAEAQYTACVRESARASQAESCRLSEPAEWSPSPNASVTQSLC